TRRRSGACARSTACARPSWTRSRRWWGSRRGRCWCRRGWPDRPRSVAGPGRVEAPPLVPAGEEQTGDADLDGAGALPALAVVGREAQVIDAAVAEQRAFGAHARRRRADAGRVRARVAVEATGIERLVLLDARDDDRQRVVIAVADADDGDGDQPVVRRPE